MKITRKSDCHFKLNKFPLTRVCIGLALKQIPDQHSDIGARPMLFQLPHRHRIQNDGPLPLRFVECVVRQSRVLGSWSCAGRKLDSMVRMCLSNGPFVWVANGCLMRICPIFACGRRRVLRSNWWKQQLQRWWRWLAGLSAWFFCDWIEEGACELFCWLWLHEICLEK